MGIKKAERIVKFSVITAPDTLALFYMSFFRITINTMQIMIAA
jgi:hypothetical protein